MRIRFMAHVFLPACLVLIFALECDAQERQTFDDFAQRYQNLQKLPSDEGRIAESEAMSLALVQHWGKEPFNSAACAPLKDVLGIAEAGTGTDHIAIISWNVEISNQRQVYGGVVVYTSRKGEQKVELLRSKSATSLQPTLDTKSRYTTKEWPGAVYYKALICYQGSRPVYTLLGWDGADNIRTRKIVETLTVSGNKLKFGVPIISAGRGTTKRYILEYSDQVSATLQWREDMNMIVMDHLSPPRQELEGQTAFYGPDMSYDGLVWKKGQWLLQPDIDVRDPEITSPWNNPKKLRRRGRN